MKPASALPPSPDGRTWTLLAVLALAAAVVRWLTRAELVDAWDSVHYILAQDRYDLLAQQPHAPGSFYYVLLARATRLLTGDPHAALLLVSALSGAGLVVALFLLGRELSGVRAGWISAAIGASAPLFWFYGSAGLNYGPAGALSALVALGCLWMLRPERFPAGALLAGGALGVLGGFRPTDVAFLMPAYLWALVQARKTEAGTATLASLGLFAGLTLGWLVPNVTSAGGIEGYAAALRGQEYVLGRSSVFLAHWPALADALFTHRRALESALGVAWLPVLLGLGVQVFRRSGVRVFRCSGVRVFGCSGVQGSVVSGQPSADDSTTSPPHHPTTSPPHHLTTLAVLIVLPAFLFYLLGHFNSPGYALTYAGFLAAVGGALCARFADNLPRAAFGVLLAGILLGNTALFLCGWPGYPSAGVGTLGQRALSRAEIADHDRYYRELRAHLTTRHPPGKVRILASFTSTDGLRIVQTLLPEYADGVAQAVGHVPDLPPGTRLLPWLRFMTPEQVRAEGRPALLIARTREDPPYHRSLFHGEWEEVGIGPGHVVYRLRSGE